MGLFKFIKGAGEKLFGGKSANAAAPAAEAAPAEQDLNAAAATAIEKYIVAQNLDVSDIKVTFDGATGKVTVTGVDWADNGVIAPDEGESYLIVNLTFMGDTGTVTTGPFFTAVTDANGDSHMMTIGASLSNQLSMRTLKPGQSNTGQVAFALPKGAVTFRVLDELLNPVATIDIPG